MHMHTLGRFFESKSYMVSFDCLCCRNRKASIRAIGHMKMADELEEFVLSERVALRSKVVGLAAWEYSKKKALVIDSLINNSLIHAL